MTVKLSELRVTSTFEAGQYKAGMDQKVAADAAGTASSEKLGAATTQTYQKISQSGAVLDRLGKQYVAGYAATAKFDQAIRMLGRGLETGNVTIAEAGVILDGIYGKFGKTADSAAALAAGYTQLADVISQKSQQISTSTALVARSLASVAAGMSQAGKGSLALNEANARLVSGMAEFGKQLKATDAALVDVAAGMSLYGKEALEANVLNERLIKGMSGASQSISGAGKTAALSAFQLTNLGFQLNDVATQAALGVGPLQILAAQGGQFFQILQTGAGGIKGSLSYLGELIMSLVTPFRVATTAALAFVTVAGSAGVAWANAQSEISLALTGIGGAAGVTVSDINKISLAMAHAGELSVGDARTIATSIAATGKVSADVLEQVTALGKGVELVFGTDAKGAADILTQALEDPAKGVDDLNKRLGAYDQATSQLIKNLTTQNRLSDAQRLITDGLQKSIGNASAQTTAWASAWDKLKAAASGTLAEIGQAVNKVAGFQDPTQALAEAQARLTRLQSGTVGPRGGGFVDHSQIAQAVADVQKLQAAVDKLKAAQEDEANTREANDFGSIVQGLDPTFAKLNTLEATLKRIRGDLLNNKVTGKIDDDTFAAGIHAVQMLESQVALKQKYIDLATRHYGISSAALGQAAEENRIAIAGINARTPAQKADIAYQQTYNALRQEGIGIIEAQFRAELARTQSLKQSQHDLSEAVRDRIYQNGQDIQQGQIQNDVIGRSVDVATRLTVQFQLLAAAKAEAFKNGTTVSAQEELQALITADEKARQAVEAARKGLLNDLSFSNAQMGRSSIDQAVYSKMQSAGLLDNGQIVGAQNQAIAAQIRFNDELQRSIDIEKGFASDFLHDMMSGKSATEALGNALNNLASKMLDNSLDLLFAGLGKAGGVPTGGLFGGNILPGIFHEGGVVGSSPAPRRSVPLAAFAGAVRYHTGGVAGTSPFKPGEMPAILQRGEIVLPRGTSAGGGDVNVSLGGITINAPNADAAGLLSVTQEVRALKSSLPSTILRTVRDAKNRSLV
ncbi:phage tail length tape measure family protein [Hyphomicrobium sp. 99]|uniref:phage tail length tape measure family protein n=1 Tax=Hyphomicrobium sp. 99 TaxID=1163419 RepID=UPI000699211A|nr:phage tail length tape measure family protein [Hyphomicrobium sp. 99]